mgnify:CR=1 FL=1
MTATPDVERRSETDASPRTDRLVGAFVRRHRIPGLSLAVVDAEGPLHLAGYGSRDLRAREPATPSTSASPTTAPSS